MIILQYVCWGYLGPCSDGVSPGGRVVLLRQVNSQQCSDSGFSSRVGNTTVCGCVAMCPLGMHLATSCTFNPKGSARCPSFHVTSSCLLSAGGSADEVQGSEAGREVGSVRIEMVWEFGPLAKHIWTKLQWCLWLPATPVGSWGRHVCLIGSQRQGHHQRGKRGESLLDRQLDIGEWSLVVSVGSTCIPLSTCLF